MEAVRGWVWIFSGIAQSLLSRKLENLRHCQVLSYLSNEKTTDVTGNEAMYSLQVNTTKKLTLFIGAAGLGST